MRIDLADDPAVIAIAGSVGMDECAVVGRLHRLWSWANKHLADGNCNAASVTLLWVDRYVSCPGFGAAMVSAGWLIQTSAGIEFPNFDRWNSQGAKRRVLTAQRVAKYRTECNAKCNAKCNATSNAPSVTHCVTREEKRREEKREEKDVCSEPPQAAASEPSLLAIPAVGTGAKEWNLTAAKLAEWQTAFPAVDVLAELRVAAQWCRDNPTKRKTVRGMPAFCSRWLTRAQDRPRVAQGARSPPNPTPSSSPAIESILDEIRAERTKRNSAGTTDTTGPQGAP